MSARSHVSGDDLEQRAEQLQAALAAGGDQLDPDHRWAVGQTLGKAQQRISLGTGHTVVALAGATGSGKSSLFNTISRSSLATVGVRRPTTSTPMAAFWGPQQPSKLLDWLGVGTRHQVSADEGPLDGLVLLDLPDFDSREAANRAEADRVLKLADVFIWVTDPQKYADAVIHEDYIKSLSARDARTIVVLNQADRLTVDQVKQCIADLRRLVADDGAQRVSILPTSATTGAGVDQLVKELTAVVQTRNAALQRLMHDIKAAADTLREGVADREPSLDRRSDDELVDALGRAAGVPVVLDAVERDYRVQATASAGWPFTKWFRRLRPDPLRRLGLDRVVRRGSDEDDPAPRASIARSSLPQATPAQRSAIDLAARALADEAASGLPVRWAQAIESTAVPEHNHLADELDQAVMRTPLTGRKPLWWRLVGVLQWIFALAAIGGLLWLLTLVILGWLQIHIETPAWGPLPYPTILLIAGVGLGLLTTAAMKVAAVRGSRRRRRRVGAQLNEAITEVADRQILTPVHGLLDAHRRTREHLDAARR